LKENFEKSEYGRQIQEAKVSDLEHFILEVANYDDYVRSKLEELGINIHVVQEISDSTQSLSNIILENRRLKL
jgi:hypothetical protein